MRKPCVHYHNKHDTIIVKYVKLHSMQTPTIKSRTPVAWVCGTALVIVTDLLLAQFVSVLVTWFLSTVYSSVILFNKHVVLSCRVEDVQKKTMYVRMRGETNKDETKEKLGQ